MNPKPTIRRLLETPEPVQVRLFLQVRGHRQDYKTDTLYALIRAFREAVPLVAEFTSRELTVVKEEAFQYGGDRVGAIYVCTLSVGPNPKESRYAGLGTGSGRVTFLSQSLRDAFTGVVGVQVNVLYPGSSFVYLNDSKTPLEL